MILTAKSRRGALPPRRLNSMPGGTRAGWCIHERAVSMDVKHLRREIAVVKQPAAEHRRQQRDDLLAQALKKHRSPGIELLLNLIEAEAGDLRVDARLRRS